MAAALVAAAACHAGPGASSVPAPRISTIEAVPGSGISAVAVVGLPHADLDALREARWPVERWQVLLRVTTAATAQSADVPPVSGTYRVTGDALRFEPAYPLDVRVAHRVLFDPARLPPVPGRGAEGWRAGPLALVTDAVASEVTPVTRVVAMFPPDVLLENQLRVYLQFSAPMGRRPARDYLRLLDEAGREVVDAFLPLDVGLWNADRTRCTLLFDPGRVKRGILPNAELGRPLTAGKRYTLVVSRDWRDAGDRPLVEEFRRDLRVAPAVMTAIDPATWRVMPPAAGTRGPLTVTFPRALDHALAERGLMALGPDGRQVEGTVELDDATTRWALTPAAAWAPGAYQLRTLEVLEDPAGNRVGRPFDADPRQTGSVVDGEDVHAEAVITVLVGTPGRGR